MKVVGVRILDDALKVLRRQRRRTTAGRPCAA